jgi:DNA-binding GntR family transcriptional regulator
MENRLQRKPQTARLSLEAEIAQLIRTDILNGVWKPGDRLVEMDLAKSFDVSQGTIRGALKYLQADALVVHKPRRGNFVIDITEQDIREISTLRDTLESLAARLAAQHITEEGRKQLNLLLDELRMASETKNRQRLIELDLAFHKAIVEIAGSVRLSELYKRLVGPALLFLRMADHLYPDPQLIVEIHEPLLAAICSGDADRAFELAHRHTQHDADRIVSHPE